MTKTNSELSQALSCLPPVEWNRTPLRLMGGRIIDELHAGMRPLNRKLESYFMNFSPTFGLEKHSSIFGQFGTDHAFRSSPYCKGFNFHETQLGSVLEYYLNPARSGPDALERCRAFIFALYAASGRHLPPGADFDDRQEALTVRAEVSTIYAGTKRRADLVILWRTRGGSHFGIGVELKLGHYLTKGQIPSLKKEIKKTTGEDKMMYDVFLLLMREKPPDRKILKNNADCIVINWFNTLRFWETFLTRSPKNTDHDFSRIRRSLWVRTCGI